VKEVINLKKSYPSPKILEVEKLKISGSYRHEEILNLLIKDFLNKCYICEYKKPTTLNVEHFIPHKEDKELKFKWENLFLSCSHCNNIKGEKYDNILNPINDDEDVENFIKYEMPMFPKSKVKIIAVNTSEKTLQTVNLLNDVYNGTTPLKSIESEYIREALLRELLDFQDALLTYYNDENDDEDEKVLSKKRIIKHINKKSAFTAFKRWIVKENEILYEDFREFID
jgi:hypothetical protein